MTFDIVACVIIWPILFSARIVVALLGLVVVPISLKFRRVMPSDREASWHGWRLVRLPVWAWPWGNLRDGAMGDVRGRYWHEQAPDWADTDFKKMFNWLALRNPCNNFSRFCPLVSVNLDGKRVRLLAGKSDTVEDDVPGFQFCKVVGRPAWGLYFVSRFRVFGKRLKIRLGHKVELKHNYAVWSDPQKARKGITFNIRFR